jgi:hypothetical protein
MVVSEQSIVLFYWTRAYLVGVRAETEMLDGLTGVAGATEEHRVGASGSAGGDLVNGQDLAASLLDTGARRGGKADGRNGELGKF